MPAPIPTATPESAIKAMLSARFAFQMAAETMLPTNASINVASTKSFRKIGVGEAQGCNPLAVDFAILTLVPITLVKKLTIDGELYGLEVHFDFSRFP